MNDWVKTIERLTAETKDLKDRNDGLIQSLAVEKLKYAALRRGVQALFKKVEERKDERSGR
jgi:hypothetical protein